MIAAPIPHDCADGFYGAFWRRPAAYLDASVRAGISVFAAVDPDEVGHAVNALGADLRSGLWDDRHRDDRDRSDLHLGYYVANRRAGAKDDGGQRPKPNDHQTAGDAVSWPVGGTDERGPPEHRPAGC